MTSTGKPTHRILVIDDNPGIHEDFRKILMKSVGPQNDLEDMEATLFGAKTETFSSPAFEIDSASQGKEGLEMVRKASSENRPYAMAFVDGRMPPGWDGIQTIRRLWEEDPDLQVVLCTAYADYSWQEIRRILGESDSLLILKKPFDNMEALQLAHALTRKWELNRKVLEQIENLDDLVRQRTEEREQTRVLLEAALMHSPAGIVITNADGTNILWSNQEASELTGMVPEPPAVYAIDGQGLTDAFREDGTPCEKKEHPLLRAIYNEETIYNEEALLKNLPVGDRWISYNAAPIRDDSGNIVAAITIFNDISEKKQAIIEKERLRDQIGHIQKMESVGLLAGGVAHDFNNTMSVILGNVELGLLAADPSEPVYDTLHDIKKAVKRSADLTQQLLAFARKQAVKPRALDMNDKVTDLIKMVRRVIGENIDLLWNPGKELWTVKIDHSQMDQILLNLCVNARDAITGVGEITIKTENVTFDESNITEKRGMKPGDYTMLLVTDNGRGMERGLIDRIFEPFFTTKAVGEGTGLGLATVYGIVKQNDGFIYVDSEPGKGTTFSIYLPRFEEEIRAESEGKPEEDRAGGSEKILLVEDDEDILNIADSMLERLGYDVLIARTPEAAIERIESGAGDTKLLITDVVMPKMNGYELALDLRSRQPELKCLFMSGYTADTLSKRGLLDEAVHLIRKPFSLAELAAKVKEALSDYQENQPIKEKRCNVVSR